MSEPRNSSTSTITRTITSTDPVATATASSPSNSSASTESAAQTISNSRLSSQSSAALTRHGLPTSQSSSSFDFDFNFDWEEPHPGQRLVLGPFSAQDTSAPDGGSTEASAVPSSDESFQSGSDQGNVGSLSDLGNTTGVSRNDTAAKGLSQSLKSSSSSSSLAFRHRSLSPLWATRRLVKNRDIASSSSYASSAPLSISTALGGQMTTVDTSTHPQSAPAHSQSQTIEKRDSLPSSSSLLSLPPPLTPVGDADTPSPQNMASSWLNLDASFSDDDGDHPMGFQIDYDSVYETETSTIVSMETTTTATRTVYGDERTIASSDGDASTLRGFAKPAHPLTDFSNLLGARTPVPTRPAPGHDAINLSRRDIGSRHSAQTDHTISVSSFVVEPNRLSHATTVDINADDEDVYGWEAELDRRKTTNSRPVLPHHQISDDSQHGSGKHSQSSSSSSSNSIMSSSSERAESTKRRRGGNKPRRQSFLQRVFSGIGVNHSAGKDTSAARTSSSSTTVPPVPEVPLSYSSTATSAPPQEETSATMPGLTAMLTNLTTMREGHRL